MDLFGLIVQYLYTYIFSPIDNAFSDNFGMGLSDYRVTFLANKFYFGYVDSGVYTDSNGNVFNVYDIDLLAFFVQLTTIIIFVLLFIVCVKFIVWLFKQISFITRF